MDSFYSQVVNATSEYLGPAADRFISRQIVAHLDKNPEKLKKADMKQLIKWIKPAMALLTDDTRIVDSYVANLKTLSSPKGTS